MNFETCRKLPLGMLKLGGSPIKSGEGKREDAYCLPASIFLLRMRGG